MRVLRLAALAALLLAAGCSGGGKAEVSGTVLLDGEPVEQGSINFIPVEGTSGPGVGAVIKDGKYHIPKGKGVTVGKNRVELRAFRMSGRKVPDPMGRPGALTDERVPAFPPEYNTRSTLVREVQPGSNTFDFEVRTKRDDK
jgi:hypothetical protein